MELPSLGTGHKLLLPLLLALLSAVLLAAPAVSAAPPASPGKQRGTCQSQECVKLAADMATAMNPAVDPCEDFFGYACGNFRNTLSPTQQIEDVRGLMQESVKQKSHEVLLMETNVTDSDPDIQRLYNLTRLFFHSCLKWASMRESSGDQDLSVDFFRALFDQFFRLEMASGSDQSNGRSSKKPPSMESLLAAMVRSGGGSLLSVRLPEEFASKALANGLNMRTLIRANVQLHDRRWGGTEVEKIATFFTKNSIASVLSLDDVISRFDEVVYGLRQDAINSRLGIAMCGLHSTQPEYTVAQLDEFSQCMDSQNPFSWKLFFERLLRSSVDTEERVAVKNLPELISVANFYKRQSVYSGTDHAKFSAHASYLIFDWLMSFGYFLPGSLRQTWRSYILFSYEDTGVDYVTWGAEKTCETWTKSYMQPVFERIYRVVHYPMGFSKVEHFIEVLKKASINSVQSQDWIGDKTKEVIVDKMIHMRHSIGLNDMTNKQLKEYYSEALDSFRALTISMDTLEKSFGSLMSIVLRAHAHRNFDIMSGSRNITVFIDKSPFVANAYHFRPHNKIVFPMAHLEPPVYHHSYPDYINLGGIGYTIGHEMGHAFDKEGLTMDRFGNTNYRLWDAKSAQGHASRAECVRGAYGSPSTGDGWRRKSDATLAEDISDILGLKAAFDALQLLKRQAPGSAPWLPSLHKELNQDQLLFLNVAQAQCTTVDRESPEGQRYTGHLPHHMRVRGMMQNSWEFARTFKCRPGQLMNPLKKCTFW